MSQYYQQQQQQEIAPEVSGILRMYTDGSYLLANAHRRDSTGAGVAYFLAGTWHTCAKALLLPLDDSAALPRNDIAGDVNDAEMLGIVLALSDAEWLVANGHARINRVKILTDSQTCITRWEEEEMNAGWRFGALTTDEAFRIRRQLSNRGISVELKKVTGHSGITGNEMADHAAGLGAHASRAGWMERGGEWRDSTDEDFLAAREAPTWWAAETGAAEAAAWDRRRRSRMREHERERREAREVESLSFAEQYARLMGPHA